MTTYFFDDIPAKYEDGVLSIRNSGSIRCASIDEARVYIEELRKTRGDEILNSQIAISLYESGEKRITESVVVWIRKIIEHKIFFPSDVVLNLRLKLAESLLSNKIEYRLNDGASVYIDIETNKFINKIYETNESLDLLKNMNNNVVNFTKSIARLLEG